MARYRLQFHVRARSWNRFHHSAASGQFRVKTVAGFLSTPDRRNVLGTQVRGLQASREQFLHISFLFLHCIYRNCNTERGYASRDRLVEGTSVAIVRDDGRHKSMLSESGMNDHHCKVDQKIERKQASGDPRWHHSGLDHLLEGKKC
jgi:hypothetical protein